MSTDFSHQLTFWDLGTQQVTVDFEGGRIVTDAGLLHIRLLDKELGVSSLITGPHRSLFVRVCQAVRHFLDSFRVEATVVPVAGLLPLW